MMMPCLDGPATIRGLHRIKPGLPVIATSGLNENEAITREFSSTTFLLKPFTTEKLLNAVSQSLRGDLLPRKALIRSPGAESNPAAPQP